MAKKKPQTVYVMLYGHKHGTDYSVYSTEEKAWECVKALILEYVNELDGADEKKVRRLLKLKSLGKALTMWAEKKEEWFEVDARTVDA
jgi:hypothetical protein